MNVTMYVCGERKYLFAMFCFLVPPLGFGNKLFDFDLTKRVCLPSVSECSGYTLLMAILVVGDAGCSAWVPDSQSRQKQKSGCGV